jgi:hypothetical protein
MIALIITAVGMLLSAGIVFAADDSRDAAFFDSVAARFREEYVHCTGNAGQTDVRRILLWKQKIDAWTKTAEYAELMRDYQKSVGGPIHPCKLIEWSKQRKAAQEAKESGFVKALLDTSEAADAACDLKACTASQFDFAEIPFGVSKPTFAHYYKKKFNAKLRKKGGFLYTEGLLLDGRPFLAAFFFNAAGKFYKYEIESDPLPADSLNQSVRPAAEYLAGYFEKHLGPPMHSSRIGFYDIKSRELALYKNWETPGNSLNIGLSVFDYHYYAKAVVVDKHLVKESKELEEKAKNE